MTRQTAEQLQISAMSVQRAQKKALEALRQQLAEAGSGPLPQSLLEHQR